MYEHAINNKATKDLAPMSLLTDNLNNGSIKTMDNQKIAELSKNIKCDSIPYGYCHCGCGQKTNLAPKTERKRGYVKGQPVKYIIGHHGRGKRGPDSFCWKGGRGLHNQKYVMIYSSGHPHRNEKGYVEEHRLIVEKIISRFLKPTQVVHHSDGDTFNNSPDNLVVCENNGYHNLLHQREIALKACGHASWRKCKFCKMYDDTRNMASTGNRGWYHRNCRKIYRKQKRIARGDGKCLLI